MHLEECYPYEKYLPNSTVPIPPYFWGEAKDSITTQPLHRGYLQGRELVGDGTLADFERLMTGALDYMKEVYEDTGAPPSRTDRRRIVSLGLSDELTQWRAELPPPVLWMVAAKRKLLGRSSGRWRKRTTSDSSIQWRG
ncbi:hypothetical protein PG996_007419 [Apiospora saccharicola]|uniref:Uncharacterized protein n=1 Tax=Apiospora saccharicola TaxID=335842 RepID=A0ABR1VAS4_9PEZI